MVLWGCVFALCWAVTTFIYLGYPASLWLVSRVRRRPVVKGPISPPVSLLIPAYNEEAVIARKIENSLSLDYPADRLEILVLSDGSTDRTETIVRSFSDPRVRLLGLSRRGKIPTLNAGAEAAQGDVLVLTDANVVLAPDSLIRLVENFADPSVGAVCGNKKYSSRPGSDTTEEGENLYWRYDKWQKRIESSIGSIFAADGAFYAVRRTLFVAVEDPAQADDIAISTRVVLQGARLLYEPEAIAWEEPPAEGREEFWRKVRVTNHSVRALLNLGSPLWTKGFYSYELLGHKLIRHLIPFFLIPLFVSSAVLAPQNLFFSVVLAGQALFYVAGFLGYWLRDRRVGRWRLFSISYFFCLVNLAAFLGVLSIVRGRRLRAWTPRSSSE